MALLNSIKSLKGCQIKRWTFSFSSFLSIKPILQYNPVTLPFKTLCWLTRAYRIKAKLLNKQTSLTNCPQDGIPDSYSPSPLPHTQWFTHNILLFLNYPFFLLTASHMLVVPLPGIIAHHFFAHLHSRRYPLTPL